MKPRLLTSARLAIAAQVALVFTASQVHAATNYSNTLSDSWSTTGNWSAGIPTNGQRFSVLAGTTVTYSSGLGYASDTLFIGSSLAADARALVVSGGAGLGTLNITGGILRATATGGPTATSLVGGTNNDIDGALNISGTGVLDLSTSDNANGRVLAIGSTNTTGATFTPIDGTITISGSGLLKVSRLHFNDSANTSTGVNLITGTVNLNGGTLETGALTEGPSGVAQVRTSSTVNLNGGLLRLTAATGISASLDTVNVLSGANIEVTTGVTAASGKNLLAVGAGGLTKTGTGTLTLTDNSTYTGATTISEGTLGAAKLVVSSGNSSLGNATSAVTLGSAGNQGTLSYTGNTAAYTRGFNIGGAGGGRLDVTTAGQTLSVDTGAITGTGLFTVGGAGRTTINAAITHTGGLTKASGSGTLTLSNNTNSYDGTTTISEGALIVTADNALGGATSGTTVVSGASLGFSGVSIDYTALETVSGSGAGTGIVSGVAATSRGFIQSVSGNNIFRGAITVNAGGVSRIGTQNGASLTLTGAITQASGSIYFRPGDTAGDYVTLSNSGNSFGGNSTIYTNATAGNYAGVRLGVDNALPTTLTILGESSTGAGTALDLNGKIQTLNGLAGTNTLNIINSNTTTASTLKVDTLVDRSSTGTVIRGGVGLGTINVIKDGAFTQTLAGTTNDYTGTTAINEGTLLMGDAAADTFATSGVTVDSGATLGGSGTISGTLAVSGNLSPGAVGVDIKTLAAGTTTWNGGSNLWNFDLGASAGSSDTLAITGDFIKGTAGTYKFDFMGSTPGAWGNAYTLVTWTANTTFSLSDFSFQNLGGSYNVSDNNFSFSGNSLVFTAVPEPTSALAGLLITAGLLRRRRSA